MSGRLRLSIVEFLNALPLAYGFTHGYFDDIVEVSRDAPAVCARKLAAGEADVGLVPAIATQTIPGVKVVPELCIAADGEVRSVILLSRRPLARVRRVAADPASRSSVALLRILMKELHGVDLELNETGGPVTRLLEEHDAVLAIGDRALRAQRPGRSVASGPRVHDLAALWKRLTGLPFVFALWAVAPGVELGEAAGAFALSRALGIGHLPAIVAEARRKVRLTEPELEAYFRRHLVYELGRDEMAGLLLFFQLAARHGVTRGAVPLELAGA